MTLQRGKKPALYCFVSGHGFSRAEKPFIFVITSGPATRDREGSAFSTVSAASSVVP
jgi:hypothetical protein